MSAEAHLAAIVESSQDAILTKDREAIIRSWNPAAERMYGYSAQEAIGQPISILIPEHRAGEERMILSRILAGERVEHYESERRHRDGHLVKVSLSVSPLTDEEGKIVGAAVIARDVTALQRARELATTLHGLTAALSREIAPARAIEVLLEQVLAGLGADAGAVGLVDATGSDVELAGAAGYSEPGLREWERFPLDAELPMSVAIRSGAPVWSESAEQLRERFPALAEPEIRFQSLAVIPLAVEGRPFGALSLSFGSQRRFDDEERAFLLAAARQAANTLERARLYEAEQLARRRMSFLAAASEVLAGSLDPEKTLRRLAELAVRRVADWCVVDLVSDDGELRNVVTAHADPARVRLANELRSRYPVDRDAPAGVANVIRTGMSELYPEITDEMLAERARDPEQLRLMRELGLSSAMIVPLEARGRSLGALTLVASDPRRRFDDADLELAEDLARRAALAIDNAMLFRREHEAAVTLQRALLPQTLPDVEGAELAARYEPAAPGLEVGGDWYDVVALDGGTVALTIGDVAGRGVQAASVMGRLRPALQAYVLDRHSPQEALERLHELMRGSMPSQMATVFHLHLDLATGEAEYVRAGHLPALVRLPDGRVEALAGPGTPPLGILEGLTCTAHRASIPPGSLLLLYTDGLIERRDSHLDAGLERLRAALAEAPEGAEECLRWVGELFRADAVRDDIAMLALATVPRG